MPRTEGAKCKTNRDCNYDLKCNNEKKKCVKKKLNNNNKKEEIRQLILRKIRNDQCGTRNPMRKPCDKRVLIGLFERLNIQLKKYNIQVKIEDFYKKDFRNKYMLKSNYKYVLNKKLENVMTGGNNNYYNKYLKYKNKYINLKNNITI